MIESTIVVLPARDEQHHLAAAVEALIRAADRLPDTVGLGLVVVLDACADATPEVARSAARRFAASAGAPPPRRWAEVLDHAASPSSIANVGAARRAGVLMAHRRASAPATRTWIVTTDADTLVPDGWLLQHLAMADAGIAAAAGSIAVHDWSPWPESIAVAWSDRYHRHERPAPVHGANLGFRLDAYLQVGGFAPLVDGEDQDLFDRFRRTGLPTAVSTAAPVVTSSRRSGQAPAGFSGYLRDLEATTGNPA